MTRLDHTGVDLFSLQPPPEGWATPTVPPGGFRKYSLVFIVDAEKQRILLGLKKRGFATGVINGFGGKCEAGEEIAACAIRETDEECGVAIAPEDLRAIGVLSIVRTGVHAESLDIHMYLAHQWNGEPIETEEMAPRWVDLDKIPYDQMHPEAAIYLPALLSGPDDRIMVGRLDCTEDDNLGWWMGWVSRE